MYIITSDDKLINFDHFQHIEIRESEISDEEDNKMTVFWLVAIGKEENDECQIIAYHAYHSASASLYNLYKTIAEGNLVWDSRISVDPNDRTEVTLHLGNCLQDLETMHSVSLHGAKLSGTPLQVGIIFETINNLPGSPDVASDEDLELWKICKKALKYVRECPPNPDGSGYYVDPNKM